MKSRTLAGVLGLALVVSAFSACVRYHARPVEPAKTLEDFERRRLTSPGI